jgi:transcription elongation factor Elf1
VGESHRDGDCWFYVEYKKITAETAEENIRNADKKEYYFQCPLCKENPVHVNSGDGSRDTYDYLVCKNCCLEFLDKGSY